MFRTSVARLLVVALLVTMGFVAFVSADHSWGGYHWARKANPFTLKLGDNVSNAWDTYLVTTSSDWSLSSVLKTEIVPSGKNPRTCRPTSGRVEVCNSTYGPTGWLGVAQIWVSGVHIVQGTVKVNDTYFNTATYNKPAWRNLVMCQEVGHTFGLDHQDENFSNAPLGTCMDYSNDPTPNQRPNAHDYEELEIIYGHLDTTTTVSRQAAAGKMPPAMRDIDLAGPGQWGRVVATTRNGRTAIHELDFGGGHKVFTFVIWA